METTAGTTFKQHHLQTAKKQSEGSLHPLMSLQTAPRFSSACLFALQTRRDAPPPKQTRSPPPPPPVSHCRGPSEIVADASDSGSPDARHAPFVAAATNNTERGDEAEQRGHLR